MSKSLRALYIASTLAPIALAAPAMADESATNFGTPLVRGGAALPRFSTSFPIDLSGPGAATGAKDNLEIALTSPDHSVLRFLFSPRALVGEGSAFGSPVNTNYVGLAWNVFDSDRLFGTIALSGAVNRQALESPVPHLYGPVMSLHSTLELGYSFSTQQSLSLTLDHASPAPYFGDYLRLRYGYHF